eukprot:m.125831 g.125831  ORF g.125831 m.125831 type:complete len:207 (+) comp17343_c0_seq1:154-774(+)
MPGRIMGDHEATVVVELLLRFGVFGCFLGHGWIAAWKLEFGGWVKFMAAAGFTHSEAHILMPMIGWMDVILAFITLTHPTQLTTAWMMVWAFSTAMVRPVSAGLQRSLRPMSDNALWGFVERASNFLCPAALMVLQTQPGYKVANFPLVSVPKVLSPMTTWLDSLCNGYSWAELQYFVLCAFALVWLPVPVLLSRKVHKSDKVKRN